jgi:16S rRNA (uracil1498-N3)-methyltransferase
VVRLGDRAPSRVARWRKIAEEATRQCGRGDTPEVLDVTRFADALDVQGGLRIVLHPPAEASVGALLRAAAPRDDLAFCVGPEGGFTEDERSLAEARGWAIASLGPRVLRTETVAAAVLGGLLLLSDPEVLP